MKFDPTVSYEKLIEDKLSAVYRGSDGRYYVVDQDEPNHWHGSYPTFAGAMESLNFTKKFWKEKMDPSIRDAKRTVRVDGTHYQVGDEAAPAVLRGFGGVLWLIEFNDGRRVASTNLWCQGNIPSALRTELPDNARFLDTNVVFKLYHTDEDTSHRMWIDRWLEDTPHA